MKFEKGVTILMSNVIGALLLTLPPITFAQNLCSASQWPYELGDIDPDPNLTRGRLSNGLRYVIKNNNEPENRVAIYLNVQAGSFQETDDQRGIAHFLEHMMFNGTKHFPAGQLIEYFQGIGMDFGNDVNAHTSYNETVYHLILPDGSKEHLEKGLLVMADYARGALLLETEIDRERGVILAEKRTRDSASYRTRVASNSFAFRGTRIPERRVIGTETVLEQADRKLLKSYYDGWYRPENMVVVIVGDVLPVEAETLLADSFSSLNSIGSRPECPDFGYLIHDGIETFFHYEPELGSTGVSIQTLWDIEPENDSVALETRELARHMGSIILQYRLQKLKESPEVPFTQAGYHYGDVADRVGYGSISVQTEPQKWKRSLTLISKTLRQALEFGFSSGELSRVKKEILTKLERAVLQNKSKDSRSIARKIIRHINSNRVYQSAEQQQELYSQLLDKITVNSVNSGLRQIWDHSSRLISVTGDTRLGDSAKNEIFDVFQASLKEPVAAYQKKITDPFPYLPLPEDGRPPKTNIQFPEIGAERFVFENGLIVNFKKTDFTENNVQLSVKYGQGELSAPVPGMAMIAEDVINGSGSGRLTKSQLNTVLAGSSADVHFSIGESSFNWSGSGLSKDFDQLLQLLYTVVFDPGLRENVFDSVMTGAEQMYREKERDIDGAMSLRIKPFLASGDPHFGLPPWETVQDISYNQLSSWVQSIVPTEGMEISVVGDLEKDETIDVVKKYFSAINLVKGTDIYPVIVTFPYGEKQTTETETSVDKSLITVAWPTDDFWDINRTRRLHILASVFEDRVMKVIREKWGATYSPKVYSSTSRTYEGYGFLATQMVVKPGEEEKITKEILSLADDLRLNGITEEELMRAKGPMITSISDTVKRNNYWLYSVLSGSSRHPDQLQWPQTIVGDYSSITTEELGVLAKKYMASEKAATAIVRPRAK